MVASATRFGRSATFRVGNLTMIVGRDATLLHPLSVKAVISVAWRLIGVFFSFCAEIARSGCHVNPVRAPSQREILNR